MFFSPFKIPSSDNPAKSFWAGRKGNITVLEIAAYDIRKVDLEITNAPIRQYAIEFGDFSQKDNILLRKDGGFVVIRADGSDVEYYDELGSFDARRTINDGSGGGAVLDWCLDLDTNENVFAIGGGGAQNAFHTNGLLGGRQTLTISSNYDPLTIDYLSNNNLVCLGVAVGPGDLIAFTMDKSGVVQNVANINSGSVPSGGYGLAAGPTNTVYVRSGNAFVGNQRLISYDYNMNQINEVTGLPTIYYMTVNNLDQLVAIEGGLVTSNQTLVVRDSNLIILKSEPIIPSGTEFVEHLGCDQFGNIYITSYVSFPEQSIVRIYDQNLALKDIITWDDLKIIGTASDFLPVGVKTWN